MILPDPPILVITDRRQTDRPLEWVAEAAFLGGCRWLSLREKDLDPEARRALLRRLVILARDFGGTVTVHDDIDAAIAAQAAGVHFPSGVLPPSRWRRPSAGLMGCSCHDEGELAAAAEAGADYATLSPIFASASKPGYGPALGLHGLASAAARTNLPLLALGGIEEANAAACLAAGAAGLAVMGAVMRAKDPAAMLERLVRVVRDNLAARESAGHSGRAFSDPQPDGGAT